MSMRTRIQPEKPHFFKPILPGFIDGVKIPASFLNYLGGKISENQAVLRRGGVKEWRVEISDQWLREGWRAFAVENNLQVGDFVVFEHEGNMVFEVLVFDPSHCERKYASIDDEKKCSQKFKAAEIPRSKKVKLELSDDQEEPDSTDQICRPYFIFTVKPINLLYHRLNIPRDFAMENGLFGRECNIKLRDQSQRSWSLKIKSSSDCASIQCGWKSFAKAQGLKEGDEFVLELTENGEAPAFNFYGKDKASTRKSGKEVSWRDEEPVNPHFTSTIEPHCIRRCVLVSHFVSCHNPFLWHAIHYSCNIPGNPMQYLPMKFARSNDLSNRSCKLILKDPKKRSWHAELNSRGSRVCISFGLDEFFTANDLKEGDTCSFELVENGETPVINFLTHLTKDDQPPPQPATDNHSYFVSTIKPYNIKRCVLHLPVKFAKPNGLTKLKGEMIVKDDRQRLWKIKLKDRGDRVVLSSGWSKLSRANGLKVGDRYKFEIIKKGKRPVVNFHCEFLKSEEDSPTLTPD
ncbi:B3 domain-containing protein REM14 isoform X2 [Coffea arabica]|uniref:B3 domain-containing protein REM14 isoform X2 n=1 Tax=Coffea arabica TaxID=13443 RepID=A0A6P6T9N0_COFAR|nr:B3 domain-containing protein REM14-like isoform X2 [Coffea arabica]